MAPFVVAGCGRCSWSPLDEPIRMRELATQLGCDNSYVTLVVTRLVLPRRPLNVR